MASIMFELIAIVVGLFGINLTISAGLKRIAQALEKERK